MNLYSKKEHLSPLSRKGIWHTHKVYQPGRTAKKGMPTIHVWHSLAHISKNKKVRERANPLMYVQLAIQTCYTPHHEWWSTPWNSLQMSTWRILRETSWIPALETYLKRNASKPEHHFLIEGLIHFLEKRNSFMQKESILRDYGQYRGACVSWTSVSIASRRLFTIAIKFEAIAKDGISHAGPPGGGGGRRAAHSLHNTTRVLNSGCGVQLQVLESLKRETEYQSLAN